MKEKVLRKKEQARINKGILTTIRSKLISSYIIMIVFIIIVGILAYWTGSNAITENYKNNALQSMDMLGEYVEFGFDNVKSTGVEFLTDDTTVDYLTNKMTATSATEYFNEEKALLTTKVTADSFIQNIYLFSDGVASISTNKKSSDVLYEKYMSSEQGKFVANDTQKYYWLGKSSVMDEELDIDTQEYAVRLVKPFYHKDAVLVMDINKEAVLSVMKDMDFGPGSYISFVTSDETELEHGGGRDILFTDKDFYQKAVSSEYNSGIIRNVSVDGKKYMFLFRKISDTGATMCALIPNSEILSKVQKIKFITIFVVIIANVIAVFIGGGLSISIDRAIQYFIKKFELVAGGDVSTRLTVKRKDEFQHLANHINKMLESVSELLIDTKEVSSEVSVSVDKVSDSSQIITDSAGDISYAMEEISDGLNKQAMDTEEGVKVLENLAESINVMEIETQDIHNLADSTQTAISENMRQMGFLKRRADETTQITEEVIKNIELLNKQTKTIDEIVDTIDNIAEETSLLSLNASIEAARAGDAGKGFMVVAESIQKLAEQSLSATENIRNIVNSINEDTTNVVFIASKAGDIIAQQATAVQDTTSSFNIMSQQVKLLLEKINGIIAQVAQVEQDKDISVEKMQNISSVTQQVVASVSTVTKSTQEQVEIVQELKELSEKLGHQTQLLDKAMQKFK